MNIFDWIFTWLVPPFLFTCLCFGIYGLLTAKRKYRPVITETAVVDKPKTKSFNAKLDGALDRAGKARKSILHSDLPEKERLQIADEILYLIDEIVELQAIKLKEEQAPWK